MIDTSTHDDDRISQLPESIAHHILSLLDSPTELVRMSVLSSYWFTLTASIPILDFNITTFISALRACGRPAHFYNDSEYVRDKFFKYVEYTTDRFCQQNVINAHTVSIIPGIKLELDIINRCIELILRKGVRVLVINILNGLFVHDPHQMYRVPDIHLSASSLTSLKLRNCELPSSFKLSGVRFKSLKHLHLNKLPIDEEVIKNLTTTCPLLQKLRVQYCYGFKRFCLYGHQNLREFHLFFMPELERIDIEAPNLSFLFLLDEERRGTPSLNFSSCKKLTKLYYHGYPSPSFADLSSNFPVLEDLSLYLLRQCKNLKLSSHSLRTFELDNLYYDSEEFDINTPNLLSFDYKGHSHNPFPLERNSAPLKARMECHPIDTLWIRKLRRFLDTKIGFKELKLDISAEDLIDMDELKLINWRPFELEHVDLELEYSKELSVYLAVVEAILWCCRPRSLTLKSHIQSVGFEEWSRIVKFTYEKLLEQEYEGETNIQIVLSSSSKPKKHFSNLTSLLTALPLDRLTQTITFIKEEVSKQLSKQQE